MRRSSLCGGERVRRPARYAQDDLSPAGDGGEGGGALHGVADEAEVGGGIGGRSGACSGRGVRGAVRAAEAVVARVGHCEDRVAKVIHLSSTL